MFTKILVPVDGSETSALAASAAIDFAKQNGASLVVIHVTQPFSTLIGFDGMAATYAVSGGDYEAAAQKEAQSYMAPVLEKAQQVGVPASAVVVSHYQVADALIDTAKAQHCDLIYIATHGRSGLSRLLLGSVTTKIIALSPIPVLVYRQA